MAKDKDSRIAIVLPSAIKKQLESLAEKHSKIQKRNVSDEIRNAIEQYLDKSIKEI
jgi:predicted DNA-binding protein